MEHLNLARFAIVLTACGYLGLVSTQAATRHLRNGPPAAMPDEDIRVSSQSVLAQGEQTFRDDMVRNEDDWGSFGRHTARRIVVP